MKKKIYIKTFGCQMNEYDSNRIYDSLKNINFEKTDNQSDADCYVSVSYTHLTLPTSDLV